MGVKIGVNTHWCTALTCYAQTAVLQYAPAASDLHWQSLPSFTCEQNWAYFYNIRV